ncbi:MAG TPA: hypothetical protein VL981_09245 [Candidatus Methylacidiphilales bacterium]|nr:hypothetical protein [Candidatus Methylacidiphilales bacterium]
MKKLAAIFLLGVLGTAGTGEAVADKTVSRDEVLKAIAVFQADPSSRRGADAAETIFTFAKTSNAVRVSLSHAVAPWMKKKDAPDADTRGMLLAAYVAGNLDAQLKSGKNSDDVYAGWLQVLATYAQLLAINPAAKISEVEELKNKEADGKLQAYAEEVGNSQKR